MIGMVLLVKMMMLVVEELVVELGQEAIVLAESVGPPVPGRRTAAHLMCRRC